MSLCLRISPSLHRSAGCPVKTGASSVHIGTQAVRTRSKEVEIGNSTHDFIKELGFDTSGRGYAYFRTQMLSLAACRMTLGWDAHGRAKTLETKPIEQFEAWLHPTGRQAVMWPGVLVLSERFYETMLEYAVPLPHSALSALKDSALALDVYSWLTHRLCRINKAKGVKVSWKNLREQFGQEYAATPAISRRHSGTPCGDPARSIMTPGSKHDRRIAPFAFKATDSEDCLDSACKCNV